ncbi:MAG: hypothetical protein KDD04_04170 [Sinomicrobium sp.]|nr:hypothetical protein [Sinomicrobium sp.]
MTAITQVIDTLEDRISKLLRKMEALQQANVRLTQQLAQSEASEAELRKTLSEWKEKHKALQLANSMLGSNKNKTEAKLKIDTLIREIDDCIAQLSG